MFGEKTRERREREKENCSFSPSMPTFQSVKKKKACFYPVLCNVTEMDESHSGNCFDFHYIKIDFILSLFRADINCKIYIYVHVPFQNAIFCRNLYASLGELSEGLNLRAWI